jgi:hypothetical protein
MEENLVMLEESQNHDQDTGRWGKPTAVTRIQEE